MNKLLRLSAIAGIAVILSDCSNEKVVTENEIHSKIQTESNISQMFESGMAMARLDEYSGGGIVAQSPGLSLSQQRELQQMAVGYAEVYLKKLKSVSGSPKFVEASLEHCLQQQSRKNSQRSGRVAKTIRQHILFYSKGYRYSADAVIQDFQTLHYLP